MVLSCDVRGAPQPHESIFGGVEDTDGVDGAHGDQEVAAAKQRRSVFEGAVEHLHVVGVQQVKHQVWLALVGLEIVGRRQEKTFRIRVPSRSRTWISSLNTGTFGCRTSIYMAVRASTKISPFSATARS